MYSYLVIYYDKSVFPDSRYGTYGSPEFFETQTYDYDLEHEEYISKNIGNFLAEHPNGHYEIYIVENLPGKYDSSNYIDGTFIDDDLYLEKVEKARKINQITTDALKRKNTVLEEKKKLEQEKILAQKERDKKIKIQEDLKLLEELKKKYEA